MITLGRRPKPSQETNSGAKAICRLHNLQT
jgi:hypothetical protein